MKLIIAEFINSHTQGLDLIFGLLLYYTFIIYGFIFLKRKFNNLKRKFNNRHKEKK